MLLGPEGTGPDEAAPGRAGPRRSRAWLAAAAPLPAAPLRRYFTAAGRLLQEHLFPNLYNSLRSSIKPLMMIKTTGAENQAGSSKASGQRAKPKYGSPEWQLERDGGGGSGGVEAAAEKGRALHTKGTSRKPTAEEIAKQICHNFRAGRCQRGDKCPRRHEAHDTAAAPNDAAAATSPAPAAPTTA